MNKVENAEVIYYFDENSCLHNEDGPAVISKINGFKEYRIHGVVRPDLMSSEQKEINAEIHRKFTGEPNFDKERILLTMPEKVDGKYPRFAKVVYEIMVDDKPISKSCYVDEWFAYECYEQISVMYAGGGQSILKIFMETIRSMERRFLWD